MFQTRSKTENILEARKHHKNMAQRRTEACVRAKEYAERTVKEQQDIAVKRGGRREFRLLCLAEKHGLVTIAAFQMAKSKLMAELKKEGRL